MTFSESSQKPIDRVSSDTETVDVPRRETYSAFQFYYQLCYMSAVAAAGLSRSQVFALGAELHCAVAPYFGEIQTLVSSLHYDYPRACRVVGDRCKEEQVASFLLRLSDALEAGEALSHFMAHEAEVQRVTYVNEYERSLDSMRKWTDAYASVLVSMALIVIINLISTMIYEMGNSLMIMFVSAACIFSVGSAWVVGRSSPRETLALRDGPGSEEQQQVRQISMIALPAGALGAALMGILHAGWGWALLISAAAAAIPGVLAWLSEGRRVRKEKEFAAFMRSLGSMASSTGTTVSQALTQIDLKSFPALAPDIQRLSSRLKARIEPVVCWDRFVQETGSQLIGYGVRIFIDSLTLGGDPKEISTLCSQFVSHTTMLREKRGAISQSFSGLTIIMHAVLAVLLLLILNIVLSFRELVSGYMDDNLSAEMISSINIPLMSFDGSQLALVSALTITMTLLLVFVDAGALIGADGGFKPKVLIYYAVMAALTGICFFVVPPMVQSVMMQAVA